MQRERVMDDADIELIKDRLEPALDLLDEGGELRWYTTSLELIVHCQEWGKLRIQSCKVPKRNIAPERAAATSQDFDLMAARYKCASLVTNDAFDTADNRRRREVKQANAQRSSQGTLHRRADCRGAR